MQIVYNLQKMGTGKGVYIKQVYKQMLGIKDDKVLITFKGRRMIIEACKEEAKNE